MGFCTSHYGDENSGEGDVVSIELVCIIQCLLNMKGVWVVGDMMHA